MGLLYEIVLPCFGHRDSRSFEELLTIHSIRMDYSAAFSNVPGSFWAYGKSFLKYLIVGANLVIIAGTDNDTVVWQGSIIETTGLSTIVAEYVRT